MGFVSVIKIVVSCDISFERFIIFSSNMNVYSVENYEMKGFL